MDGVEASTLIEATLASIAAQYGIDPAALREAHFPILEAMHAESAEKQKLAESKGYERGRIESEMRHWFISTLGFGMLSKGDDAMDKAAVHRIIDTTIRSGSKTPKTMWITQLNAVQDELKFCNSTAEVIALIEANRGLIEKLFGVSEDDFTVCFEDLAGLDVATK
jgi:hypothetical protein